MQSNKSSWVRFRPFLYATAKPVVWEGWVSVGVCWVFEGMLDDVREGYVCVVPRIKKVC